MFYKIILKNAEYKARVEKYFNENSLFISIIALLFL